MCFQILKKLRILDLNSSHSLTKCVNFCGLENLEKLSFCGCHKLEELHSFIGCLHKLAILDLQDCRGLKTLPWEMIKKLRCLREFYLNYCDNIGLELDEVMVHFMSSLKECPINILEFCCCNILKIPDEVGSLRWLKQLNLNGNKFHSLPGSLEQLHELKTIGLANSYNIRSI